MALPRLASQAAEEFNQVVRAVFLDRDGVINANLVRGGRPVAPTSLSEFHILPGTQDALFKLKSAGFEVIVVTNQPDVATGHTSKASVEAMHAQLRRELSIDDIKVCYHVDLDNCTCRKPKPGLILAAAAERNIDLATSYMIGDRWRDVGAGKAAGCLTIFVDYGYVQDGPCMPDTVVRSPSEAIAYVMERERSGEGK
jgi:D-glycero-D-manno-heptose 1,7-bisphosphate phosphatase